MSLSSSESKARATRAIAEQRRRQGILDAMEADSFPAQWKFITDPSRRKAALTTRRAGKSMSDAMMLLRHGIKHPGRSMIYTGVTDSSAWRILWKDCLRPLSKKYGIELAGRKTAGEVEMKEYGSIIYFLGIDNSAQEMEKAFGQKFGLCVVDEGAIYKQDTRELINSVLFPATADYEGTVAFTGMPCNNVKSFFFDVTTGKEPGWSLHEWTWADNPYVAKQMKRQVDYLIKTNPGIEDTPTFKQHYRGKWAIDKDARIYKFDRSLNVFDHLPESSSWHYVLGIDLGWDDPTAFVLLAYRDYDPTLYVVETYQRANMTISEVANQIHHYIRLFRPDKLIIDGANKQAVEEMKDRHRLPLVPADKAGKADFINICNDDFIQSRVKVRSINCAPLITELETLVWDEKKLLKGVFEEPSRAKNHCADAFLYGWRYCYNWVDRGVQISTVQTQEEKIEAFWAREAAAANKDSTIEELEKIYGYQPQSGYPFR